MRPPLDEDITINVCLDPVDFRMGINGLSVVIEASLKYDPFSHNLLTGGSLTAYYQSTSGLALQPPQLTMSPG